MNPLRTAHEAITLPFKAIGVIALCFVINLMTSPGHWWVQWVVLGMGIAVVSAWWRAAKLAGGVALLAGIAALLWPRRLVGTAPSTPPPPPASIPVPPGVPAVRPVGADRDPSAG